MNTRLALFCILLLFPWAHSQTPSKPERKPLFPAPEAAVRALYNKTLSDLGAITLVRISVAPPFAGSQHSAAPSELQTAQHTLVWRTIETAELRDYTSVGVALGLPPQFTVEYADGTKARADKYSAMVIFPDGKAAYYGLYPRRQ